MIKYAKESESPAYVERREFLQHVYIIVLWSPLCDILLVGRWFTRCESFFCEQFRWFHREPNGFSKEFVFSIEIAREIDAYLSIRKIAITTRR